MNSKDVSYSSRCQSFAHTLKTRTMKAVNFVQEPIKALLSIFGAVFMGANNAYNVRSSPLPLRIINTVGPTSAATPIYSFLKDILNISKFPEVTGNQLCDLLIYTWAANNCWEWCTPDLKTAQKWAYEYPDYKDIILSKSTENAYRLANFSVAEQMTKNIITEIQNQTTSNRKILAAIIYSAIYFSFRYTTFLGKYTMGALCPSALFNRIPTDDTLFNNTLNSPENSTSFMNLNQAIVPVSVDVLDDYYRGVSEQMALVATSAIVSSIKGVRTCLNKGKSLEALTFESDSEAILNVASSFCSLFYSGVFFNNSFSQDGIDAAEISGIPSLLSAAATTGTLLPGMALSWPKTLSAVRYLSNSRRKSFTERNKKTHTIEIESVEGDDMISNVIDESKDRLLGEELILLPRRPGADSTSDPDDMETSQIRHEVIVNVENIERLDQELNPLPVLADAKTTEGDEQTVITHPTDITLTPGSSD